MNFKQKSQWKNGPNHKLTKEDKKNQLKVKWFGLEKELFVKNIASHIKVADSYNYEMELK
jgi:hypothetical protein